MDNFENKALKDHELKDVAGGVEEAESKKENLVRKLSSLDKSGPTPKFAAGMRILYWDDHQSFPGVITKVSDSAAGWTNEEFEYSIKLDEGSYGICWEHQLKAE